MEQGWLEYLRAEKARAQLEVDTAELELKLARAKLEEAEEALLKAQFFGVAQ